MFKGAWVYQQIESMPLKNDEPNRKQTGLSQMQRG